MAIDEIVKGGKVVKAAKAAKAAKEATEVIVDFRGARYAFPPGTTKEAAERVLWNKVVRPELKKDVQEIELPDTLTLEQLDVIAAQEAEARMGQLTKESYKLFKEGKTDEALEIQRKAKALEEIVSKSKAPTTADVLEFKPKRMDPGVYLDEDSGKYFRIDKDGNIQELTDEAP